MQENVVLRFDEHITVCANVHAQTAAVLLSEMRKLMYKTILCPFICGKFIEFAAFLQTVVITPVNKTKHLSPETEITWRYSYNLTGLIQTQ